MHQATATAAAKPKRWNLETLLILLGIVEGLTKVFYPEASNTVIFVVMVIVLILRPAGLFGRER